MDRRGLASLLFALALAIPTAGSAQEQPAAGDLCAALGDPTGLYRSADGSNETRWKFNSAGDTVRPGDPFLAEHVKAELIERLGAGTHYVLFGEVGPGCETATGTWRAVFPPEGERLMAGQFTAKLEPGTISFASADDDAQTPHGWKDISTDYVVEPDPPVLIVFADPLQLLGQAARSVPVTLDDQLAFSGSKAEPRTVLLDDGFEFRARVLKPGTVDLDEALEFHGPSGGPLSIALDEGLSFAGNSTELRPLTLTGVLQFHGKPLALRAVELAEPLQFSGDRNETRIVRLGEPLRFEGVWPSVRTVVLSAPLEFHRRREATRNVATAALSFRGKTAAQMRVIDLAGPLIFQGQITDQQTLVMPARLVFPGDTASARAALTARPVDPTGAGPCGTPVGDSIARADFEALIPASPDDVTVEAIDGLLAAYTPYAAKTAQTLDTQADCMEQRLEAFSALIKISPHDRWAQNPAFNGQSFYSGQIEAVRNAALYLRQVDWELAGIDQAMKDTETFHIFDLVDDPEAMKFGLVTDGGDAPEVLGSNSMKMSDFELLLKHAENDANALLTQRNRYFQRKIAQRFRYLDALVVRTTEGLADWTALENHLTRSFMPRVASAITTRINELKKVHDETQPATAPFVVPQGEFDGYFSEFTRLAQTSGPKIGNASFRDFMNNKVWYSDYDSWPDTTIIDR